MRKSIVLAAILFAYFNVQGWAQSSAPYAHTEIYGGFSVLGIGDGAHKELYGWQAGMTTSFKRSFGIATDFAGQYKGGINVRQSLFGPQFSRRSDGKTIFARALFGTSRAAGANAFTMGFGGGLDLKASDRFSVRVIQADWLPTRAGGQWSKERGRIGSAILLSFGRR